MVGKFTDPVASEAISGLRKSALPRTAGSRPRPPVENCTMMPGHSERIAFCTWAKSAGSEEGVSSALRTWMWASEAPASNASRMDSICSAGVIGTAGLSRFLGTDPVMATAITTGFMSNRSFAASVEAQAQSCAWVRRGRDSLVHSGEENGRLHAYPSDRHTLG